MIKKLNLIGVAVGVIILIFAIVMFALNPNIFAPRMKEIFEEDISSPSYELDEAYGGDAYTGIQNAAAQTANNLIPVFNAVRENSEAIMKANSNNILQAEAEAENLAGIVTIVKCGFGFSLLTVGLLVISKSVTIELPIGKKEEQTSVEI